MQLFMMMSLPLLCFIVFTFLTLSGKLFFQMYLSLRLIFSSFEQGYEMNMFLTSITVTSLSALLATFMFSSLCERPWHICSQTCPMLCTMQPTGPCTLLDILHCSRCLLFFCNSSHIILANVLNSCPLSSIACLCLKLALNIAQAAPTHLLLLPQLLQCHCHPKILHLSIDLMSYSRRG